MLFRSDGVGDRERVREAIATVLHRCQGCPEEISYRFLDAVLRSTEETLPDMLALTEGLVADERSLSSLVAMLSLYWMGVEVPPNFQAMLLQLHQQARMNGFLWVAMESAELLAALSGNQMGMQQVALELSDQLNCRHLTHINAPNAPWKQSLQELIEVTRKIREPERSTRLCWLVDYADGLLELTPREQKRTATGGWTKGRSIAFQRLLLDREVDYLTSQDRSISDALYQAEEGGGKNGGYVFNLEKALPALIGHPLVFLKRSPLTPVEIVAGEPELVVERKGESL